MGHGLRGYKAAKHFETRLRFLHEHVRDKSIEFARIDTKDQLADGFTKPLPGPAFMKFRSQILKGHTSNFVPWSQANSRRHAEEAYWAAKFSGSDIWPIWWVYLPLLYLHRTCAIIFQVKTRVRTSGSAGINHRLGPLINLEERPTSSPALWLTDPIIP